MKKSPTLLMKELKAIETEISEIHNIDERDSSVPVNELNEPKYNNGYSYEDNRTRVKELQLREAHIRHILNVFNMTTKIEKYGFTVSEALVRIGQLRNEIKVLQKLGTASRYVEAYGIRHYDGIAVTCYDIEKANLDLKSFKKELAELQVEVDRINLNSVFDD